MDEYRILLKKATLLHFMFMNMSSEKVDQMMTVYVSFRLYSKKIVESGKVTNLERIGDFDTLGLDVIQVLIIYHIQNMV